MYHQVETIFRLVKEIRRIYVIDGKSISVPRDILDSAA